MECEIFHHKGDKYMNDRVLQVLEFDKIIDQLRQHVDTSLGDEWAKNLVPSTRLKEAKRLQQETDEAAQFIRLNQTIPLGGIFDIRPSVKRCSIGGILQADECLEIGSTIRGSRRVKKFIENSEEELPLLKNKVQSIDVPHTLEKNIKRCINEEGEVIDSASAKLRSIRSSIRSFEQRIRERLETYTQRHQNLLSEAIITIRNNRYVLPVKSEHRSTVGGIVHDQSASGQTLFMEPRAVVDINNQLREAKVAEAREIERILRDLSEQVATYKDILLKNVTILAEIDFIDARAQLGREMDAVMPNLNDQGIIQMQQARHPLIPREEVVANDVELGEDFTSILITGPNTGGKTVVLKMIGLCTLMAQSGLQVPAMEGCKMAVFQQVFADIGDEQSIEQNLSTFSSHMKNIVQIVDRVNDQTLVLFDEIGAGTDPQEGAALAMAILDDVISRGARVVVTTHYPELKAYGYNRDQVVNASVEFDSETLQPTYRLLIGVPGRSNAFDISKRLGLDENIIQHAKSHIGIDSQSVETMISSLEQSQKQAESKYETAHRTLKESTELYKQLKKEWEKFQHVRDELYKEAEEKAKEAIHKARREAEAIVGELRKKKEQAVFKEHEWIEARKSLDDAAPSLGTREQTEEKQPKKDLKIKTGDEVKVLSLNREGNVLEKINDDEYLVQIGMMRVNIRKDDLEKIAPEQKKKTPEPVTMVKSQSTSSVGIELDLRGQRFEEAMQSLEQYIDRALLAGHAKVSIIHGKGTGALRSGVQEFAKKHPNITSYRSGKENEGGSGVTIIELT